MSRIIYDPCTKQSVAMALSGVLPYAVICVLCCLLMYSVTIGRQCDCPDANMGTLALPNQHSVGSGSAGRDAARIATLESALQEARESFTGAAKEAQEKTARVKALEAQMKAYASAYKANTNSNSKSLRSEAKPEPTTTAARRRQIFIDMGANDGSSVNYFMQTEGVDMNVPWTQGGAKDGKLKGRGAHGQWDLYVVEANPYFTPVLMTQREKYLTDKKHVASYNVFGSTAITTENGNVTFKLDVHNKGNGNFGSTLMTDSRSVLGPKSKSVTVAGVDIVDFLRDVVKITPEDYVVLKIDIEGKEYDVLKRLVTSGTVAMIDDLAVEYHHNNYGVFGGRVRSLPFYWAPLFFAFYWILTFIASRCS